jgi:hypothetical protein
MAGAVKISDTTWIMCMAIGNGIPYLVSPKRLSCMGIKHLCTFHSSFRKGGMGIKYSLSLTKLPISLSSQDVLLPPTRTSFVRPDGRVI